MNKPIHASVIAREGGVNTSFYFKGATVGQLCQIKAELDLLGLDILDRIDNSEKEFEIKLEDEEEEE